MNLDIIKEMATNLKVRESQIQAVLKLLEEGNTIPFIARYRKEATGNLDEEVIRSINEVYEYEVNLLKRKEDVIRLIDEKGLLTEELKANILKAKKLVEVEDLYRPYKEKKKTKATEAIKLGLEPLAKTIMGFPWVGDIKKIAKEFLSEDVITVDDAIKGASFIIAEWISDNASYRKWIRSYTFKEGIIKTSKKKSAVDEKQLYEMYYDYQEPVKYIKSHRVLAVNRAEKEKIVIAKITIDEDKVIKYLEEKVIENNNSFVVGIVKEAIKDSYKRLIKPSIEREIRSEISEKAEDNAIDVFAKNLESLLLQPPMKEKVVLGFDPAFRTGCKLAVLDKTGKQIDISVIYPHEPKNDKINSKKKILDLINKYDIDIIAIGNGTASRESESFIVECLKDCNKSTKYIIVNEAGASVYSASKLAIKEFPNLHVEERSAISIGRRLQDPLSELVKIDPESIGVGQYQHDVNNKKLSGSLDFTVTKVVNNIGVNINTASSALLSYVSGLSKKIIGKIINYRDENGKIKTREEIKKIKGISPKVYEQSVGFLRIIEGDNKLDSTSIHPESYKSALKLLGSLDLSIDDLGTDTLKEKLTNVSVEVDIDKYTLEDIIKSLKSPLRDPRDSIKAPLLKSDVLKIDDLKEGMKLEGTVRNVVDFGAFIDIGLKNDGLAHISKLTNRYIKHPMEVVNVGDIVDCYVIGINLEKKKVSLSLLDPKKGE